MIVERVYILRIVRRLIQELKAQEKIEDTSVKKDLWQDILNRSSRIQRRQKHRKRTIAFLSAAALLFLLVYIQIHKDQIAPEENYFANTCDLDSLREVVLMVSKDEQIEIAENAEVVYSMNGTVSVNEKNLAKEESPLSDRPEYNQLIVPKGKRATLVLSDRTKLWVNSGTRVVYPRSFSKLKREIFIDGEAYLEVTPNPELPFLVRTESNFTVEVLGTSFNICTYKELSTSTVVLVKGSVKVKDANRKEQLLEPNQLLSISKNGLEKVESVDVEDYTGWIHGVWSIHSEALSDVLAKLAIYFGVQIRADETLQNISISGKLELKGHIPDILSGLANIVPISYIQNQQTGAYEVKLENK